MEEMIHEIIDRLSVRDDLANAETYEMSDATPLRDHP